MTRLSLRLGVVVLLGVVLLFGAGVLAATQVQQDLLPDISVPAVMVITPYPGASPDVVDGQVTVPIVNAMEGITGTDTVQSTSSQGASLVIVLFRDGIDLKSAEQDVNSAVVRIRPLLPPQASASTVQTFSTNSLPILEYAISADEPLGDLAAQLRAQALPKLKGLAGVSSVVLTGAPTDEVDVTLDPDALASHGVTVTQVAAALQQSAIVESIGSLKQGSARIPLQVSGSLTSLDQIGKVTVTLPLASAASGRPVQPLRIDQLGTVRVVSLAADTITRTDGKPSIGLQVIKGPNTNTVTVANEVWTALPGIRSSIGHNVHLESIQDQASPITQAVGNILREGLLGAVFAVLDAAEDRRFKPLGDREGGREPAATTAEFAVSLTLEPEPGLPGDRRVLEVLADNGLTVEPVAGTAKMRIRVDAVQASTAAEASLKAADLVRDLVPATGYLLSEPEPVGPLDGSRPLAGV